MTSARTAALALMCLVDPPCVAQTVAPTVAYFLHLSPLLVIPTRAGRGPWTSGLAQIDAFRSTRQSFPA